MSRQLAKGPFQPHSLPMTTIYDFLSVGIFAIVAFVYLQRSVKPPSWKDNTLDYVLCAIGCAGGNWLGNEGYHLAAIAVLALVCVLFTVRLHPFRNS